MQILIEAQADVNKGKKDKTSPLYIASQKADEGWIVLCAMSLSCENIHVYMYIYIYKYTYLCMCNGKCKL